MQCGKLRTILITKNRPAINAGEYPSYPLLLWEFAGGREVEQEGVTVNKKLVDRLPLSSGKSSYTVPILYLK